MEGDVPKQAETKERIQRDLSGDLLEVNHATRRFFRCWLDGSYLGYDHYQVNLEFLKANHDNPKKLRMFVISEFTKYTAHDADCSYGYAQKVIVETISKDKLEKLNNLLIEDALDLIADWLEERKVA